MAIGPTQLAKPFYRPEGMKYRHKGKLRVYHAIGYTADQMEAIKMAEGHRELDCPRYDECLDKAVAREWQGFSCGACEMRVQLKLRRAA